MKKFKRLAALVLVLALALTGYVGIWRTEPVLAEETGAEELTMVAREQKRLWIPGEKKDAKWSSSDKAVATVTKKGIVTALNAGNAVITAKTKSGETLTWNLTVLPYISDETAAAGERIAKEYAGYSIFADPDSVVFTSVERGKYKGFFVSSEQDDYDYIINYTMKNEAGQDLQYGSRYNSNTGSSIHYQDPGDETTEDVTEYTFTAEEVERINELYKLCRAGQYAVDTNIVINASTLALRAGDTFTLSVSNTGKKIKWKSTKKSVAAVNKKGVVTAKTPGRTTIAAKVDGKKLTCQVYVLDSSYTDDEMRMMSSLGFAMRDLYAPEDYVVTGVTMGEYEARKLQDGIKQADHSIAKVASDVRLNDDTMGKNQLVIGVYEDGRVGGGQMSEYEEIFSRYPGTDTKVWTQEELDVLNEMLQEGMLSGIVVYPVKEQAEETNVSIRMFRGQPVCIVK